MLMPAQDRQTEANTPSGRRYLFPENDVERLENIPARTDRHDALPLECLLVHHHHFLPRRVLKVRSDLCSLKAPSRPATSFNHDTCGSESSSSFGPPFSPLLPPDRHGPTRRSNPAVSNAALQHEPEHCPKVRQAESASGNGDLYCEELCRIHRAEVLHAQNIHVIVHRVRQRKLRHVEADPSSLIAQVSLVRA